MNKDEIKGKAQNVKGRVKEAGTLTGNRSSSPRARASGRQARSARKRDDAPQIGEAIEDIGEEIKR